MNQKKKTFQIVTLGCRTNQYESQAYRDQLDQMGYREAEADESADVCVVNTCTVTQMADTSSRQAVRQLARHNPDAKIVVTGCSAERERSLYEQMEGVVAVVSNDAKEDLLPQAFPEEEWPEFSIKRFDAHTRAFVKVQDGCNSYCSYCVIPYVRGRSRSRTVSEVVAEVKELIANGYREVVLTGINIGDFDGGNLDNPISLAELVCAVDAIPGLERLRLSSIDPDEVDDALLEAIVHGKNTCPSMHIVLQSGSNVVLKRMRRKYTRQMFMETADRLLAACPDFTFTTDVIVGFPGETEQDHQETLAVIEEVQFAKVHMFPYSKRPKTRAARMPNQVEKEVKRERKQEVIRVSERVSHDLRERYVGRRLKVLTESRDSPDEISGHTENFLMVRVQDSALEANTVVEVDLVANTASGLIGEPVTTQIASPQREEAYAY